MCHIINDSRKITRNISHKVGCQKLSKLSQKSPLPALQYNFLWVFILTNRHYGRLAWEKKGQWHIMAHQLKRTFFAQFGYLFDKQWFLPFFFQLSFKINYVHVFDDISLYDVESQTIKLYFLCRFCVLFSLNTEEVNMNQQFFNVILIIIIEY